ncbi:hypothetical protein BH20ACT24_BH20ACT24_20690 [soil metagenome]
MAAALTLDFAGGYADPLGPVRGPAVYEDVQLGLVGVAAADQVRGGRVEGHQVARGIEGGAAAEVVGLTVVDADAHPLGSVRRPVVDENVRRRVGVTGDQGGAMESNPTTLPLALIAGPANRPLMSFPCCPPVPMLTRSVRPEAAAPARLKQRGSEDDSDRSREGRPMDDAPTIPAHAFTVASTTPADGEGFVRVRESGAIRQHAGVRRGGDSNPRGLAPNRFSKPAP